jgi:hypothetical protein
MVVLIPDHDVHRFRMSMDLAPSPVIHEVVPTEILAMIFEEHAKLEWRAPAIDGRVCRFWRQLVLNTPRVWVYLEIYNHQRPKVWQLRSWLRRSSTMPLHICVGGNFTPDEHIDKLTLYDLISEYHTRIASLQMMLGDPSFFEGRGFPCLQLLDIEDWYSTHPSSSVVQWGAMPELRYLRLGSTNWSEVPLSKLTSLKVLALYDAGSITLPWHPHSLTTLMLDDVNLGDGISGLVAFPSLTYLSLYDVWGFKPRINAPCLVTFHEGGYSASEPFPAPLTSLVEYGMYGLPSNSDPAEYHLSFPNIRWLSLRASEQVLFSFLDALAHQPQSLSALQKISVGNSYGDIEIPREGQKAMEKLILVRSEACKMGVVLCFETGPPFQLPIFFGAVSWLSTDGPMLC